MSFTLDEYCGGVFHLEESVEMSLPTTCLCEGVQCLRKSVTCIVQLVDLKTGEQIFVSTYRNRKQFGNYTVHAEKLMIWDWNCLNAIRSSDDARVMTLYLTYQPCHYSGGHTRPSTISCTEELLKYKIRELDKHNIQLHIKVAYIYRAFWNPDKIERKYWRMIENAQNGIRLLKENKIALDAFDDSDWAFIHSFCGVGVQQQIKNLESVKLAYRKRCDAFNQQFLREL